MLDADNLPEFARIINTHPRIKTGDLKAGTIVRVIELYAYRDGQRTVLVSWREPRRLWEGGKSVVRGTWERRREMKVGNLRPLRELELLAMQAEEIEDDLC